MTGANSAKAVRAERTPPLRNVVAWSLRGAPEAATQDITPWGLSSWFVDLAPITLGTLLIAAAFACSRHGLAVGSLIYWLGQATIFVPSALRLLSQRTSARSRLTILVGMAAAQSFLAWAYSPDMFRFPDEFQHIRTLTDILRNGHLFTANSALPQSPAFPGLEIGTDALMKTTGLSMFSSGHIFVAICHALLPVFMFLGYRELAGADRTASIAALVYSMAPHYSYFEVLFIYSTPALTFLALTFATAMRAARKRINPLWVIPAFLPAMFCHHLTAFAGIGLLVAISVITFVSGSRRRGLVLGQITLGLILVTVGWTAIEAPSTFAYLGGPLVSAGEAVLHVHATKHVSASTAPAATAPIWETLVILLTAGLTLVMSFGGIVLIWWSHAGRTARLFALTGSLYPAVLLIRLFAPDGTELSVRFLTYSMIVIAYPLAVTLMSLRDLLQGGRARLVAIGLACLLGVGAIVSGLPPSWERMPGKFEVASSEAGIDPHLAALGPWSAATWPRNTRAACDFAACSIFQGSTNAALTTIASRLYYAKSLNALNTAIADQALTYVQTDARWTRQIPPTQTYFPGDTEAGRHVHPLPRRVINQFDQDRLLERVYDDGTEHVYDTFWVWNA